MLRLLAIIFALSFSGAAFSQVGFYSPSGFSKEFTSKVDISLFNFSSVIHMQEQLEKARQGEMKVYIELGETLNNRKKNDKLVQSYDGLRLKKFPPKPDHKLLEVASKKEITRIFSVIGPTLEKYADTVEAIFIADEPYLNGINAEALDQLAKSVRIELDNWGLSQVKTGVVFASALFNSDFAQLMNDRATQYAISIDNHYNQLSKKPSLNEDERFWVDNIERIRLTTYDQSSNIYTEGGIPDSIDIIGFNYYLSTLLQDFLHEESLAWFADYTDIFACKVFKDQKVSEIRKNLDIYQDIKEFKSYDNDRIILEKLYSCRMKAALSLLKNELAETQRPERDILIISESSTNNAIQRNKDGSIAKKQPSELIKTRVTDEVSRALNFYKNQEIINTLLFFVYFDEFDYSLKLNIGGVENNKLAKSIIFKNTERQK